MIAWLGLGSNQHHPVARLLEALAKLAELEPVDVLACSCFYSTPAWGDEDQEDFVNAVAKIVTDINPLSLLGELQSIENVMGRQRSARRWGPRIIDIDLLLYGDIQYRSDDLVLPHPHMHERAFVLMPLCEIDKSLHIPGFGNAEKLLRGLDSSAICCLGDRGHHEGVVASGRNDQSDQQ